MADRILLVGPKPPPTGGIASHIAALSRALAQAGIPAAAVDPRRRLRLVGDVSRAGLAGDLVHVHVSGHNRSSYGLLAACLAATPARPAMVTLHSGLLPGYLARVTRTGLRTIAGLLARASAVVCVTEGVARPVRALGLDPAVASPFVAAGMPHLARPPVRIAAAHAAGERIIAAAVAPGPEYGLEVLAGGFARVAAHRRDVVLALFGPGGADRLVARRLGDRGLGDRVLPLGELTGAEALATLAAADVVVRPTLADGDAVSVREARALGRAVVASDCAERPRGTRIFPAGDSKALADEILAALAAPAPPAVVADGLPALLEVYRRLEIRECAALPAV